MPFNPINTQEEFDNAIRERIQRERDKYADYEELKGQVTALQGQVTALTGERDALDQKVKGYETNSVKMRIAQEMNIPSAMAERLTGDTEEAIRKDAEAMAKIFANVQGPAPLYDNNPPAANASDAALTEMLHSLRGE